jgi:predicted RecA/RadA family phage recombinase
MPKRQIIKNHGSYTAEVAITAFMAVVEGTDDGECTTPSAADVVPLGVSLHSADAGERVSVARNGDCVPVTIQTAVARGEFVCIQGTTGKVKPAADGADTFVLGRAQNAGTTDGDRIYVEINIMPNPVA